MENTVEALQQEVQVKLGRCILRLQQYERLLKAMVTGMTVKGTPEQLQSKQAEQAVRTRNMTLGALVGRFTACHLPMTSLDGEVGPDEETGSQGQPSEAPWVSMHFTIPMSFERHAQTSKELADLVTLRNDLVHHLIERFDISDVNDCRAASTHLDSCYEKIDSNCRLLMTWAQGFDKFRTRFLKLIRSKAFEDAFVHGINPDGSVDWPRSTIAECLREAEMACQVDGWAPLDAAIGFISKTNRDQIPTRYGCRTWRQLLKRSGQFELRSVVGLHDARGQTWYRSCVNSSVR